MYRKSDGGTVGNTLKKKPISPAEQQRRENLSKRMSRSKEEKAATRAAFKTTNLAIKNAATLVSQDIGEIPACVNPERRAFAIQTNKDFCDTYLPMVFNIPWSNDHLRILPKADRILVAGGKQAIAMPRGSGKTQICLAMVLRACLSGLHPFAMYVGAVSQKALDAIKWIKNQLMTNQLLYEDFPEVCYPIRRIDDEPRKCLGQHCGGVKTKIKWSPDRITLPTITGSPLSAFTIGIASMDSNIRGGFISLPDGRVVRPSIAVVDDFQTDESAASQGPGSQTEKRLLTITRAIQGLAGPNGRISIFLPCTVIERGDGADTLLNRKNYPDFHGERTKRLISWPTNAKLWERYREIREDCQRIDLPPTEATEFYRERMCNQGRRLDDPTPCAGCDPDRECMDCGACVDWVERLDNKPEMPEEERNISSLQAAMHSFYEYGPIGFASEFQNEPLLSEIAARMPSVEEICNKANGYQRGVVPQRAVHTVAFIDAGEYYHFFGACSFEKNFSGALIDYGTWPDQGRVFSKQKVNLKLMDKYPGTGPKGALLAGLVALMEKLKQQQYQQDGGPVQNIEMCLIDTGHFPDEVHAAIRMVNDPRFRPSRGVGITAGRTQFVDYKKDRCRDIGNHWWIPKDAPNPTTQIDTNYWKTAVFTAITTAMGDPGSLTLFGKPEDHSSQLMAAHFLAEYYTLPSTEKGVSVQEWHQHVGKDNEGLDMLVGCMVCASKLGCSLIPMAPKSTGRPVVSYAQRLLARSA
jgi:hypothetical protein